MAGDKCVIFAFDKEFEAVWIEMFDTMSSRQKQCSNFEVLTHFMSRVFFDTPSKISENLCFSDISEGYREDQWHEMG